MIDFANRAKKVKNGSLRERDLLWRSNFRYIIARNILDKDAINFFSKFAAGKDGKGKDSDDFMDKSRVAVSYALYINRKNKEEL